VRVAVLEDQALTRAGIVMTLEDAGIEVVAAVGATDDLHRVVGLEPVDVAVLDVRLPPTYTTEGLDAAARIRREQPRTAVLVLSQYLDVANATSLLETAGSGSGYLLKDRVLETATLVDALRRVAAGECVLDPAIVAELVRVRRRGAEFTGLTDREYEVLAGIAEGLTNLGIARQLGISDRTVEVHVQRLFTKLDLPTAATANRRVLAALHYLRRS
jgi:DNA-binding NarL/FixJ family response regulator